MRRIIWIALLINGLVLLAACEEDTPTPDVQNQQIGPLDWDNSPETIILRIEQRLYDAPPAEAANTIPLCTVWGDGRIVWVNELENVELETDEVQILESRISEQQMRSLIEDVIFTGFYDWESNFIIPELENPFVSSITLNLMVETRTVERYTSWPANGFDRILTACQQISDTPAVFLPQGLWVSAYRIEPQEFQGEWRWIPEAAGFNLADVADGSAPQWITGDFAALVWENTILASASTQVLDNDATYELAIQVPGVSRDSPPTPN